MAVQDRVAVEETTLSRILRHSWWNEVHRLEEEEQGEGEEEGEEGEGEEEEGEEEEEEEEEGEGEEDEDEDTHIQHACGMHVHRADMSCDCHMTWRM